MKTISIFPMNAGNTCPQGYVNAAQEYCADIIKSSLFANY